MSRADLVESAKRVIEDAFAKLNRVSLKESDRQSYMRIINGAVASCVPLIRDEQLDQIKARLKAIEKK